MPSLVPVKQDEPKLVPVNDSGPRLVPVDNPSPRLVPVSSTTTPKLNPLSSNFDVVRSTTTAPVAGALPEPLPQAPPTNSMEALKVAFTMAREAVPFPNLLGGNEATRFVEQPAELSKEGLKAMTDKIPDAKTGSATANIALNLAGAVPKVLAEFAPEFLRPRNLLLGDQAFGVMAKGIKESAGFIKMAEKVSAAIPAGIKRVFTYRFGQPELYKDVAEARNLEIAQGVDKAIEIGKQLTQDLSQGEQLRVAQIIRGGISTGQAEVMLRDKAGLARVTLDALEREAKDLNLIPENAMLKFTKRDLAALRKEKAALDTKINNIRSFGASKRKEALLGQGAKVSFPGKSEMIADLQVKSDEIQKTIADYYRASGQQYLPRLYDSKEVTNKIPGFAGKPNRMDVERFMKRGDIPEDVRKAMGEILTAGYPTAKGIAQVSQAVATAKMFRNVARNAEWSTLNAEEAALRGFTRMPEGKKLGELSGRFVHPEIARDINEITRVQANWEKLYGSVLSKWKFGKTVLGFPAAHFRNMIGNTFMMDMGGVDPLQQATLIPRAAKEILKKGKWFDEAKSVGLLGNEFYGGEIAEFRNAVVQGKGPILEKLAQHSEKIANALETIGGKSAAAANKLGKIYQAEEQTWKLAKFIKNRESGMAVKEAATDAEKYLFNYAKISPFVKEARKFPLGTPFITYTSKALPVIAETLVTNPLRVMKYEMLFKAIEQTAMDNGTVTPDDLDTIRKNSYGRTVVLPVKDENGDPLKVDLSYLLPWGDIGESGGWFGLPSVASPSGPVNVLIDLGRNNSTFKAANGADPQIWKNTDLPSEKLGKASDYALKAFLPSITPGIPTDGSYFKGGYTFQKMANAIQRRPDYFGRVRDPFLALMDSVLGIKIMPADPELMKSFEMIRKKKDAEEARTETLKILRNQGVSDTYKAKRMDSYVEKINRIFKN